LASPWEINNYKTSGFVNLPEGHHERLKEAFLKWYADEKARLLMLDENGQNWVDRLPACPKKLECRQRTTFFGENDCSCKLSEAEEKDWEMAGLLKMYLIVRHYHEGAEYELRTRTPENYGGSGTQCVYDKCGNLISKIPGAGSADFSSPNKSAWIHFFDDVIPYDWACELDRRSATSQYVKMYYEVRPVK